MPYHTRPARPKPTGWAYLLDYQIHNGGSTPTLDVQPGDTLWCRAHEGLHVRSGPHTHANIAGLLRIGENVKCLQCQEWNPRRVQWARIRTHDGIEGWAAAGWLMADYVRPAIGVKGLIAPPSLYAALCQSQRLLTSWKRSTVMPRLLLAIAALESDVRTRADYGGMLVSRFEEGVFDRLRKTVSSGEARRQSTSWGVMQVMGFHFHAPCYAGDFRECRDWLEWLGADTAHEWIAGAHLLIDRWGTADSDPSDADFVSIAKRYNGAGERTVALAQHRTPYDQLLAERYALASVMTYDAYTQEDRDMAQSTTPESKPLPPDDHSTRTHAGMQGATPIPPPYRPMSVTGRAVQAAGSPVALIMHAVLVAIYTVAVVFGGLHFNGRMQDDAETHNKVSVKQYDFLDALCRIEGYASCEDAIAALDAGTATAFEVTPPSPTPVPSPTQASDTVPASVPGALKQVLVLATVNLHTEPVMTAQNKATGPIAQLEAGQQVPICVDPAARYPDAGVLTGYRYDSPYGQRWFVSVLPLPTGATVDTSGGIPRCTD